MTEPELKACIQVVQNYFLSISGEIPQMGIPFIKTARHQTMDYTGVIGISGVRRGGVYFTASRALFANAAQCILGEDEPDDEIIQDMAGEITNTIAGNLRELFGSGFLISVPIILKGQIEDIMMRLKPPVFIIPLRWRGFSSQLALGLE
jgi:chemotaxis protein CheX